MSKLFSKCEVCLVNNATVFTTDSDGDRVSCCVKCYGEYYSVQPITGAKIFKPSYCVDCEIVEVTEEGQLCSHCTKKVDAYIKSNIHRCDCCHIQLVQLPFEYCDTCIEAITTQLHSTYTEQGAIIALQAEMFCERVQLDIYR